MPLSVDQFGKALVASGLMPADELKAVWAALPTEQRPKDGETFAGLLVKRGTLNEFQSQELLSGSGTPLVLGDYVLLAKIGAGGMGQVFKAQHRHMKRLVAVKLLPAAVTKDERPSSGSNERSKPPPSYRIPTSFMPTTPACSAASGIW